MRQQTPLYLALTILVVFSAVLSGEAQKWEKTQSYEGRFEVACPGTMVLKERDIYTDIGTITYFTHYFWDKRELAENDLYMVSYCDYPAATVHSDSIGLLTDFFENTIDAATQSVGGELRYSEDWTYKGYPGKYWRIDYRQETATLKTRVFLVKNRLYTIQTATERGRSMNAATDRFFRSFELLSDQLAE